MINCVALWASRSLDSASHGCADGYRGDSLRIRPGGLPRWTSAERWWVVRSTISAVTQAGGPLEGYCIRPSSER